MDLTTCYIDATITRDSTNPTFPPPPDRPRLPFLSFLEFPYLLSFLSVAASLGPQRNSSPLFPITCRLFSQKHGGYSFTFPILLSDSRLASFSSFDFPIPPFRASSCLLPLPPAHLPLSIFEFRVSNFVLQCKFIRINTCERISKQMTSTPPESHSYKKHGGG